MNKTWHNTKYCMIGEYYAEFFVRKTPWTGSFAQKRCSTACFYVEGVRFPSQIKKIVNTLGICINGKPTSGTKRGFC